MKVVFKQPRLIDGVFFDKGERDLPKKFENHWYFKALVGNGDVVVGDHVEEEKKSDAPPKMPTVQVDATTIPPVPKNFEPNGEESAADRKLRLQREAYARRRAQKTTGADT